LRAALVTKGVPSALAQEYKAGPIRIGVPMDEIKSYPRTGRLCDGRDPEGNVFPIGEERHGHK
jgi:hypothetical protein